MKKRYAVTMEDNQVVQLEVNGEKYASVEEIPDPRDQARMETIVSDLTDFDDLEIEPENTKPGKSVPFEKIILGAFLTVAVILLTIAGLSAYGTIRDMSREVASPGRVIDMSQFPDSSGEVISYPIVQFALPDGRIQTEQLSEGSNPPSFKIGEEVTVLYNSNKPHDLHTRTIWSMIGRFILPIITGFLGVCFAGAVFFVWRVMSSSQS
jgi:hypothetical protein